MITKVISKYGKPLIANLGRFSMVVDYIFPQIQTQISANGLLDVLLRKESYFPLVINLLT